MAFSNWLALGIIGLIIKKQIARSERTKLLREQEYEEYEEERRKQEIELNRQKEVDAKRMRTPCNFDEGIAHEEFLTIVRSVGKSIKRIKKVTTSGPVVYCTVESQSGHSEWDFNVDFNDWGHVTGTYWKSTENHDSNIPDVFGEIVSDRICRLLRERNINFPDFSNYVNDNKTLETSSGLSWCRRTGVVKKIFSLEKPITIRFDSCNLVGEHIYPVVSILKNTGFKNVKSIPIKDVGRDSDKYVFEVEQVVINGISFFEVGEIFPENAEVIIIYHVKQEIKIPYSMGYFQNENYIDVGDQLREMGFSNIYERKIKDLVFGWITKDGSVEKVLIECDGKEVPIKRNHPYDFDAEIVIEYHTFSKK